MRKVSNQNTYTLIMVNTNEYRSSLSKPFLWVLFILYIIILGYGITHHELWGDELHSWNIAKASNSFTDLIFNTRYEGHPPVWYSILWVVSKITHDVTYIQLVQYIIAALVVFVVLFFSPFSLTTRILIPFGYYFLFEYGVFSRNYAIGLLLAFCICFILRRNFRYKPVLYYTLLFLLSNTHLLAIPLAAGLQVYFLLLKIEQKEKKGQIILHAALGVLICLPALYFISPPSSSQMNTDFWVDRWNIQQLITVIQAPLRSFIPVPAWWSYNFWNTQVLLELQTNYTIFKFINPVISLILLAPILFILSRSKKSVALFLINLLLTCCIGVLFPLTSERYTGFIFIGFLAAYWLYRYESPTGKNKKRIINILLIIHLVAGFFAIIKDIHLPFSNSYKVNELINEVPSNEKIVTDYWALNTISAFTDKPFYCIDMQRKMSFILWASDLAEVQNNPHRYTDGIKNLFQKEGIQLLYMISTGSPQILFREDSQLSKSYRVKLIDKREGAIEKGSNLYLYQISSY